MTHSGSSRRLYSHFTYEKRECCTPPVDRIVFPTVEPQIGTIDKMQHHPVSALRVSRTPWIPKQQNLGEVSSIQEVISTYRTSTHSHDPCFAGTCPMVKTPFLPLKNVLSLHCLLDSPETIPQFYTPILLAATKHLIL